jgi:hypothetical protein
MVFFEPPNPTGMQKYPSVGQNVGDQTDQSFTHILIAGLEDLDSCSIQLGMSSSQLTNSYFSEV